MAVLGRLATVLQLRDYAVFLALSAVLVPLAWWRGAAAWEAAVTAPVWRGDVRWGTLALLAGVPGLAYVLHAGALHVFRHRLARFKLQPSVAVTPAEFNKALRGVAVNQLVSLAWTVFIVFVVMPWRGCSMRAPLPAVWTVARDFAVFILAEEVVFFHGHMALHSGPLYARFHKIHHEFPAPIGLVAVYSHWGEQVMNLVAVFAGPVLMGSHAVLMVVWTTFAIINTINAHCGYELPGMPSPRQHDWHHERFKENLGFLGVLDSLYGTNTRFVAHERARLAKLEGGSSVSE